MEIAIRICLVMVSMLALLTANCSFDAPPQIRKRVNPTDPPSVTVHPDSGEANLEPIVTFISGQPPATTSEKEFTITIKGNTATESYQWALVDGNNCNNASYNPAITFPDNKQDTFTITDQGEDGDKTLCAIGLNKDTTSQPKTHSWQRQSPPPPPEQEEVEEDNKIEPSPVPMRKPESIPVPTPPRPPNANTNT